MTRKMGDFDVYQRTKDAYFDASSLLQQWNEHSKGSDKKMSRYLETKQTKEFMEELSAKMHHANNQENMFVVTVKGRSTGSGRIPDTVWMHPYVFLDFAMWLNPRFEVQVIKF